MLANQPPWPENRRRTARLSRLTTLKDTARHEHRAVSRKYRPGWMAVSVENLQMEKRIDYVRLDYAIPEAERSSNCSLSAESGGQ